MHGLRIRRGLNHAQLAELVRLDLSYLQRIEWQKTSVPVRKTELDGQLLTCSVFPA